jgi:hypothetical protein
MGLDGFFNRLKTKENRDLNSRAREQAGILGSYALPHMGGKLAPPPGLRTEFRKAEELLSEGADSGIDTETQQSLRDIVNRIRAIYRLY